MKMIFCAGFAPALYVVLVHSAFAQWQGGVGLSARSVTHSEYDMAGRRLVREKGWLPGVVLDAAYKAGDITWFGAADGYQSEIDYHGQTQAGAGANSTTSTRLASVRIGGAYDSGSGFAVLAALELDHWKRDIHGTGASAGLQETYRTRRVIAGIDKAWHTAAGLICADAGAIFSEPEHLRVGFSGLLDPASLDTKRSHGFRAGGSLRPAFAPHFELRGSFDWMKIPRSDDATVSSNGQFKGTIAQPEHIRQRLTLAGSYVF
jgi:hypothetical protein